MRGQDDMQRSGIGMTSQRTRERLIQRLYEEGLSNARVLEVIRRTPRHLFVDEALAHRAYELVARRPGDVASCYADPALAEQELGWKATLGIEAMCADGWRWQSQNPEGYHS